MVECREHGHEGVVVEGLGDIAVGMILVCPANIGLVGGGGEDDNRQMSDVGGVAHFGEEFVAGDAGQIEVEKDQLGSGSVLPGGTSMEKVEGTGTVRDDVKLEVGGHLLECLAGEQDVGGVVLDEEEVSRR